MISSRDIIQAFKNSGLEQGRTVFCHSNIGFFGRVENASNMDDLAKIMLDCFTEVLGKDGTLVLPVFTYSFGANSKNKIFDVQNSLSTTSGMGNWLIRTGNGSRSIDPMLSVIAIGGKAEKLTKNFDGTCFGLNSIWSKIYDDDAMICNLNLDSGSTYLHWLEKKFKVSYRHDMKMSGEIIDNEKVYPASIIYTGRKLDDPAFKPMFEIYHQKCVEAGITKKIPLGRGQIVSQSARNAAVFLEDLLKSYPNILTKKHLMQKVK